MITISPVEYWQKNGMTYYSCTVNGLCLKMRVPKNLENHVMKSMKNSSKLIKHYNIKTQQEYEKHTQASDWWKVFAEEVPEFDEAWEKKIRI